MCLRNEKPVTKNIPRIGYRVRVKLDDIDRHGEGCECGLCNSNGKSYGAGVYINDELVERVYAASEQSALHSARLVAIAYLKGKPLA